MGGRKAVVCALACGSLLVLPPFLLKKDGAAQPQAAPVRHVSDTRVAFRIVTPTTLPPAPAAQPAPPTTVAPAVTTPPTTAPYVAPTTTTMPVRALAHSRSGEATWYGTGTGTGYCASPYLPRGTWAVVTNLANGATIRCMVSDAQVGSPSNRIVDLAPADFATLAGSTAAGVVQVTVSW